MKDRQLVYTHHMPRTGNGTAKCVHAAFRVNDRCAGVRKNNARSTDGGKRTAVANNTGSNGSSRIIPCAADHFCAGGKPGQPRRLSMDRARNFR